MSLRISSGALARIRRRMQSAREEAYRASESQEGAQLGRRSMRWMDDAVVALVHHAAEVLGVDTHAFLQHLQPVALGSYGRGDFCPHSDVDLMLLKPDGPSAIEGGADLLLYALWDLGLQVGHAVRTVSEAVEVAMDDHTVLSALIELRPVMGDAIHGQLRARIDQLFREADRAQRFIEAKLEEAEVRRARFGGTVYMLEPNVKESPGGIRELHLARWVAYARWRVAAPSELLKRGVLSDSEGRRLLRAQDFMLWLRWHMHRLAKRRQDHLRFDMQEKLARIGGWRGQSQEPGRGGSNVERLMRAYYFHASALEALAKDLVDRATQSPSTRTAPFMTMRKAPGGFKEWNGHLTVAHRKQFSEDPAALVRLFKVAQDEAIPIYSYTRNLIRDATQKVDRSFRRRNDVISELFWLIEDPKSDGSILDDFHQLGVLRTLIPEFRRVTAKWQHSLYHVYTVDVHSLQVLKNLKRLRSGALVDQVPNLTRWMSELYRPHVVYFAGLLHDVGKGWPRDDHSARGERVARAVGARFEEANVIEWSSRETEDLAWLVREHLLMSDVSQRRDISDPVLLADFARRCKTAERLTMLHILTFADMLGTSPKVWTTWKGALLDLLHENALILLNGDKEQSLRLSRRRERLLRELEVEAQRRPDLELSPEAVKSFSDVMPPRYIFGFSPRRMARHVEMWRDVSAWGGVAIHTSHLRREKSTRLTVVCPDRPGLLAVLAGTLAANRMQILSAQIFSIERGLEPPKATRSLEPTASATYDLVGISPERRTEQLALDVLHVTDEQGNIQDDPAVWRRFRSDLEEVLFARMDVHELFERRRPLSGLAPRAMPAIKIDVAFNNRDSAKETIIDVWGPDHLGVLYHLADALTRAGLSISLAKVSSQGGRIADGFYVTDAETGEKIQDHGRQARIRAALEAAFERSQDRPRSLSEIV
ncbi:MAG: [protein-PII] uridylyltransferase [Myxococcota bacterium]